MFKILYLNHTALGASASDEIRPSDGNKSYSADAQLFAFNIRVKVVWDAETFQEIVTFATEWIIIILIIDLLLAGLGGRQRDDWLAFKDTHA